MMFCVLAYVFANTTWNYIFSPTIATSENNTKPADLSERIVFKTKDKTKSSECQSESKPITVVEQPAHKSKKARKAAKDTKSKLSFAFEDDDSEDL